MYCNMWVPFGDGYFWLCTWCAAHRPCSLCSASSSSTRERAIIAMAQVYYEPGMAQIPVVEGKVVLTSGVGETPQAPGGGAASGLMYAVVSNGMHCSYFVRSDGVLDRSQGWGKIHSRHACNEKGVTYVSVATGPSVSYAIRSDGKVDRFKSATSIITGIECPDAGVQFVAGSCSELNSYLLGSNGAIYRFRSPTDITRMDAKDGKKYVSVSAGQLTSYFVRDDGCIEFSRGSGSIGGVVEPVDGLPFVGVSSQTVGAHGGKGEDLSNTANYFVRADGCLFRTTGSGNIGPKISPPAGLQYLAASASMDASYYVRSDGAIDRTTGSNGSVSATLNPPPGVRYVAVSAHMHSTYLLRSDGICDRSKGWAKVHSSVIPSNEPVKKPTPCVVM